MNKFSTKPPEGQSIPVPVTGGELTRSPICAVCGQPAATSAFVADAGMLQLCYACFDLFGFEGGEDGHPQ